MESMTVLLFWLLAASNCSVVTVPIPAVEVTSPFSVTLAAGSLTIWPVAVTVSCMVTLLPRTTACSLELL